MGSMREVVGVALSSGNLRMNELRETAADRIAALARCKDELSSALWRAKYGAGSYRLPPNPTGQKKQKKEANAPVLTDAMRRTESDMRRAVALLTMRVHELANDQRWRIDPLLIGRMCEQIVKEWVNDVCPWCRGTGMVAKRGQPECECPACNGIGKARFRNSERARAIGVSAPAFSNHWERKFNLVMDLVTETDRKTNFTINYQLGRFEQ